MHTLLFAWKCSLMQENYVGKCSVITFGSSGKCGKLPILRKMISWVAYGGAQISKITSLPRAEMGDTIYKRIQRGERGVGDKHSLHEFVSHWN